MESALKVLTTNRKLYSNFLENYSLEQLNKIPPGFSNNLIWNAAHVVAIQQRVYYKACGLPMNISEDFFERYKPGSQPNPNTTIEEVNEVKSLLYSLVDKTHQDFETKKFTNFNPFTTITGFALSDFNDAMQFNNYHEGLHVGLMMNLRKFV